MLIWLERETAAPAEGQKGEDSKEAAWPVAGQEREKTRMTTEAKLHGVRL